MLQSEFSKKLDSRTLKISVSKVVRDAKGEIIHSSEYLTCCVPINMEKDVKHVLDVAEQLYKGSFPKPQYEVSVIEIFTEVENMKINY